MNKTQTELQKAAHEIVRLQEELFEWHIMSQDEDLIPPLEYETHSARLETELEEAEQKYEKLLAINPQ